MQASSDRPLAVVAEAGAKLTPSWSLYGDAWVQPGLGRAGGDVAARYGPRLDLYAGGAVGPGGSYSLEAGVRRRF